MRRTLRVVAVDGQEYCMLKDTNLADERRRLMALQCALLLRRNRLNLDSFADVAFGGSLVAASEPDKQDMWYWDGGKGDVKLVFPNLSWFHNTNGACPYTGPLRKVAKLDENGDEVKDFIYEHVRNEEGEVTKSTRARGTDGQHLMETVYDLYAKHTTNGQATFVCPPAVRWDFFFFLQMSLYLPANWNEDWGAQTFHDALWTMCMYHIGEKKTYNWFIRDAREVLNRFFDPDDPDCCTAGVRDWKKREAVLQRAYDKIPIWSTTVKPFKNKKKRLTPKECLKAFKCSTFYVDTAIPEAAKVCIQHSDAPEEAVSSAFSVSSSEESVSSSEDSSEDDEESETANHASSTTQLATARRMATLEAQLTKEKALTAQIESLHTSATARITMLEAQLTTATVLTDTQRNGLRQIESLHTSATARIAMLEAQLTTATDTQRNGLRQIESATARIAMLEAQLTTALLPTKKRKAPAAAERPKRAKTMQVFQGDDGDDGARGQLLAYDACSWLWYNKTGRELVETNIPTQQPGTTVLVQLVKDDSNVFVPSIHSSVYPEREIRS